jgi:hypothetical protein
MQKNSVVERIRTRGALSPDSFRMTYAALKRRSTTVALTDIEVFAASEADPESTAR